MNTSIYEAQNYENPLKILVAQRQEYRLGKSANVIEGCLIIAHIIIIMIASYVNNDTFSALSLLYTSVLTIISCYIRTHINRHRTHAALLQQYFDVTLFSSAIGNDPSDWGELPTKTDIIESISSIDVSKLESVKNWYNNYSDYEPTKQVLLCQKANISWDKKLRTEMKGYMVILFFAISVVLMALAFIFNPSFIRFITILTWLSPLAYYFIRNFCSLHKDIKRLEELIQRSDEIDSLLSRRQEATSEIIKLQQLIMDNRKNATLIPDWFYKIRKDAYQKVENVIADTERKMGD